jgi:hypothetical protein
MYPGPCRKKICKIPIDPDFFFAIRIAMKNFWLANIFAMLDAQKGSPLFTFLTYRFVDSIKFPAHRGLTCKNTSHD